MTTTTRTFEKINDIFNCKLLLEDGREFTIPLREDGYIYATGLCKVAGKKMYNWLRLKETQKLQKEVDKKLGSCIGATKSDTQIRASLEVHKGNTLKYTQGTWIHPDLGINLAQWCCASFADQVSKWIRELIFTGTVEIGKEKSNDDINAALLQRLKEAEAQVEEQKKRAEEAENLVVAYDRNHKVMETKYRRIHLNHQAYLRRKELYRLKEGPCVYIIDMKKYHDEEEQHRYKIGQTGDITNRVSGFRTSSPFCKVIFVLYTDNNVDLEKTMKIKYEEHLLPNNSEFVTGVSKETMIEHLLQVADIMNLRYTIESDDELRKFNRHLITVEEINDDEILPTGLKRCGGFRHKTEEERMRPLTEFFKQKSHKDGVARLCKECYLVGVYGDNRKRRKKVVIPQFDPTTHKWCNRCENVKEYKDFMKDKSTKDGHNANCKACKLEQKKIQRDKKKQLKETEAEGAEEAKAEGTDVIEDGIDEEEDIIDRDPLYRFQKAELRRMMKAKGLKVTLKMNKTVMINKLQA
jgi:hypothetical protein